MSVVLCLFVSKFHRKMSTVTVQKTATTTTTNKNVITIKGSAEIVAEFFGYSVNSILFQRGVYPPDSFARVQKYGLGLFVTNDEDLKRFITCVLAQMQTWLETAAARKLVLVLSSIEPVEVLERWTFDIETTPAASDNSGEMATAIATKSLKEINGEIAAIMRQISASVTFLPLLETACSFDLLVYTAQGVPVPVEWEESAPRYIENAQHVRLRSVDTTLHSVDTTVAYAVHA